MGNIIKIKDFEHRIIGTVETDDKGNKIAKDFYKRIVGRYDAKSNLTKDFYYRIVARGDAVASLIPSWDEQNRRK